MKLVEDISKITTIPEEEIQLVLDCIQDCICYDIQEKIKNKEDYIDVDIGIGQLNLNISEDMIEYKFIPSSKLEDDIKYTLDNNQCPLINKIEKIIRTKILGAYKEFF